jgi:hypothetical protein
VEFFSGTKSALATVTTLGFGFTGAAPELEIGKIIPMAKIIAATNNIAILRILHLLFKNISSLN